MTRLGVGGLVLALAGASELLALERSFARGRGPGPLVVNRIRLYRVFTDGATDVSRIEALTGVATLRPVAKGLVLDFATLISQLPPELKWLDNFEGMSLGPAQPDGTRSLVLVSDDNFNPLQRTAFLLLRVRPRSR